MRPDRPARLLPARLYRMNEGEREASITEVIFRINYGSVRFSRIFRSISGRTLGASSAGNLVSPTSTRQKSL
jgi:hypothetical protein